jgi:hypothetical protein
MNAWFGRVGTGDALPEKMPALWLATDPSCPESHARYVADGCEEEGIPLAWEVKKGDAAELARFACLRSQLEVGIGIGADGEGAIALVAVTDKPYIVRGASTGGPLRWLGQAAARISKSQPIPRESERVSVRDAPSRADEPGETDDAEALIRLVTAALLKEMREGEAGRI